MATAKSSPKLLEGTKLAKTLGSIKKRLIAILDLSFLDKQMDNGPGRNPKYPRSTMTKALIYAISQEKYSYNAIEHCLKTIKAKHTCNLNTQTPVASTICRFWKRIQPYLPLVFQYITNILDACNIYGDTVAVDATSLKTKSDDPDAVWAFDEHEKDNYYYGYGLLTIVDCNTDLPISAVFTQRKQHPEEKTIQCFKQLTNTTNVEKIIGDAWYDTINFQKECLKNDILPICTYNPRNTNTDKNYEYRIEKMVEENKFKKILDINLDETFNNRQSAERLFGLLKNDNQKLEFDKHGYDRVKTQVFLVLINRLLTALSKWVKNSNANLRSIR